MEKKCILSLDDGKVARVGNWSEFGHRRATYNAKYRKLLFNLLTEDQSVHLIVT